MRLRTALVLVVAFAVGRGVARGSAFSIFENGVRASGMAGAFGSIADDPSAIFYNPAGLVLVPGTVAEGDLGAVIGKFRYTPSDVPPGTVVPSRGYSGTIDTPFIPLGDLYYSRQLSPNLTAGLGLFAPFGLAANFKNFHDDAPKNERFVGRFAGLSGKLLSLWLQPTLAYRIDDQNSIGLGVALVHSDVTIEQSLLNPEGDGLVFGEFLAPVVFPGEDPKKAAKVIARMLPEIRAELGGSSDQVGVTVGYLFRHRSSATSVGFMYRSSVVHHIKGDADFNVGTGYALEAYLGKEAIPALFPDQKIRGAFRTPATWALGASTGILGDGRIAVEYTLQDYSRFEDIRIYFTKTDGTATPAVQRLAFDFENGWVARVGIEKPLDADTTVRAGYFYDHSPVRDASVGPLFPDSDRHNATLGATRRLMGIEASFFYQAMFFRDRTTDVPANDHQYTNGLYKNFVHIFGFGLKIPLG